jgi:molybdopterin synthase catalytic subunit
MRKSVSLIAIVDEPLSLDAVAQSVQHAAAGAVVTFTGTVRRSSQGHTISYLEYSAYKPMAEREMQKVADEVKTRWGFPCSIVHRVGRLEIGEASVIIAVASPHRHAAFEACHWAINRLKETVPVWKKEGAIDGYWWVEDPLSGPASSPAFR